LVGEGGDQQDIPITGFFEMSRVADNVIKARGIF